MPGTVSSSTTSIAISISTACGVAQGLWRPSSVTRAAAILLPDSTGALAGPSRLFDDLASRVQRLGGSVLQLEHQPGSLDQRVEMLLCALEALRRQGVERMALIGWELGASLAIAAGAASDAVTGVAALAPDPSTADRVTQLTPRRLLLLHGSADVTISPAVSRFLYARASDPKELVVYPGERHDFSLYHDEALEKLTTWTRALLRNPFKPSVATTGPLPALRADYGESRSHESLDEVLDETLRAVVSSAEVVAASNV